MGYGSAGYEIFDPVARALLEAKAPDEVITNTCAHLIKTLTEQDWDTLEDSIQEFADEPAVLAAFERVTPDVLRRFRDAVPELFVDQDQVDNAVLKYRIAANTDGDLYLECPECRDIGTSIDLGDTLDDLLEAARTHHSLYPHDDGALEDAAAEDETSTDDELLVDLPHGLDPGQVC